MRTSTQLLLAIVGNTLVALLLFGSVAYYLFLDHHSRYQNDTLQRIAGIIEDGWHEADPYYDTLTYLNYAHEMYTSTDAVLVVLGRDRVEVVPDDTKLDAGSVAALRGAIASAQNGAAQARVPLDIAGTRYLWAPVRGPEAGSATILLEPLHKNWTTSSLGARLILASIACTWLAVWVALILSAKITGKLEEKNDALRNQAIHDSLTGLPNRVLLADRLNRMLQEAQRNASAFSLVLLDLDNFKDLNDTLGHHYGDRLLQEVAKTLLQSVRAEDTVARLGGDEFAILLQGADFEGARACIKSILKSVKGSYQIMDTVIQAHASLGVAVYPLHGDSAEELMQHADVAMYQAKRAHSDYEIYSPEYDTHSLRRLQLMNELRSSMVQNHFSVHYQPLIDRKSGVAISVEALARWEHPLMGFIAPDEFIPVAEHTGTIRKLTEHVLRQALGDCARWQREGYCLGVSVNISPRCLRDDSFPELLLDITGESGLVPASIELEITETALMNDILRAEESLARLHDAGFRLAIDDFGTGFSSLHRLKQLPVDTLKIDKSFILDIGSNRGSAAIVLSIIELAHNFNCRVVAEGVENESILDMLDGLQTDLLQGYLFARPMTCADFEVWLKESEWRPECGTSMAGAAAGCDRHL